jgi:S-adenosylmethionine synthetase
VEASAKAWLRRNLRFVDPDRHVLFQNEIKPGSAELTDLFERERAAANDTSVGFGYAPPSDTERLVLAAERHLNGPELKSRFPEAGEDVKVMGYRRDRELRLTVALAFVDRHVPDARTYFARNEEIREALCERLAREPHDLERIQLEINTLDDPARGERGMYLTVLGTSAEGADGGEVGRGNRVNGLIAFHRPMSTEAAAGKNPVRHTGKIYNVLAHSLAAEIHAGVPGLREVYVWLCSQIGQPIDEPLVASTRLVLQPGVGLADVRPPVESIIQRGLTQIGELTARLARGELPVC